MRFIEAMGDSENGEVSGSGGAAGHASMNGFGSADAAERHALRNLYMEVLTEGAGEELDELRTKEHLDESKLGVLIDALESGASAFNREQRQLALDSLRANPASHKTATSNDSLDGDDVSPRLRSTAEEDPIVAKALALVREVQQAT